MPTSQPADTLSTIGIFLTLIGLLGSFFYIHLSDWYSDVVALAVKWKINRFGDDPDKKAARRECRYEVEKVASWTTLLTTIVVTAFVLLMSALSIILWRSEPNKSQAWQFTGLAGMAFLAVYIVMTAGFTFAGYRKAAELKQEIRSEFESGRK